MHLRKLALAIMVMVCLAVGTSHAEGRVIVATKSGPPATIVCASGAELMQRTAAWCRDYLQQRGLAVSKDTAASPANARGPLWVIETLDSCPVAESLGVDCSALCTAHGDAYALKVAPKGDRAIVCIVGKDVIGVRSAVARLAARLRISGDQLTAPAADDSGIPFFAKREIVIANRGMVFRGTPWEYTHWRTWSDERIRKYAEQIWLLGFNSLQTHEGRYYRVATADKKRLDDTVHKTLVLMQAARDNGLQVTQLIWGQSPYNKRLCWNAAADRAIMEQEFRWMATTYGSCVDRVVINFRDPGGCPNNCPKCDDYRTPQEIAGFILREYRKVNPRVNVTLSTWQNPKFWNGEPSVKFLDETYCPKQIAIALHKRYDPDQVRRVHEAGREVDIWGWYLTDHETTTDLSLCMTRVDKFYSSMPEAASKNIRVISNELCFHGWPNILSAYVTAQKMWDPHRDLGEMEREFCASMFGEINADAMVKLYQTCEQVVNPPRSDSCLPELRQVFGSPDFNKRSREALAAAKTVKLDPAFTPSITTATEPQSIADYLLRNLSLISVLSEAQEKVNVAKKAGANQEALDRLVKDAEIAAEAYKLELDYPGLMKRLRDSVAPRPSKKN